MNWVEWLIIVSGCLILTKWVILAIVKLKARFNKRSYVAKSGPCFRCGNETPFAWINVRPECTGCISTVPTTYRSVDMIILQDKYEQAKAAYEAALLEQLAGLKENKETE